MSADESYVSSGMIITGDATTELVACAERYMQAVKRLGEESGYNRLTYFEAPILKMPTEDMREEAHERWLELNISGLQLSDAVNAAKLTINEPRQSPASASPCLNCGDPSHEPFCGTCREMGCVGEKPSLPVKNDHAAQSQASAPSLREALRPFAAVAAVDIGSDEADGDMFSSINHHNAPRLTVGDFRRALAALSAPAKPQAAQVNNKDLLNWIENEASRGLTEGDAREALTAIKWKIKDGRG